MNATTILKKTVFKRKIIGQSRLIICNDCGNKWIHFDRSGFRSATYFCDLCANKKSQFQYRENKLKCMNSANLRQCGFGGSFKMDASIQCPQCKSSDFEIGFQISPFES